MAGEVATGVLPEGEAPEIPDRPETPETGDTETHEGEPEHDPEPPSPPPPAPAPKSEYQRRIDQLTREKHEERRKREALAAELADLKRKADAGVRPEPPDLAALTNADGLLDPAKYRQAMMEYEDKRDAWLAAQRPAAPATPPAPEPPLHEAIAAFVERSAAVRAQHADYDEVVSRPVFTGEMREALWESEVGPQLAYELGTNQAEALRIGALPPAQQYREIGRLEAKLVARTPAPPAARVVSAAPAPITPVNGSSAVPKDPEKMTMEEFVAWDRQQTIERLKRSPFGGG